MRIVLLFAIASAALAQDAEKSIKASDCTSCHAVDHQVVDHPTVTSPSAMPGKPMPRVS